jgi:hypothetical protein
MIPRFTMRQALSAPDLLGNALVTPNVSFRQLRTFRRTRSGQLSDNSGHSGPYSISSSAVSRNGSGIVSPNAFAVLRLMTSSNLVGCWTGRSLALAPLRIRST